MKCFTAETFGFWVDGAGYSPSNPSISGIFFFFLCGHGGPPSGENAVGIKGYS